MVGSFGLRITRIAMLGAVACGSTAAAALHAQEADPGAALVALHDTGETRDGLPVLVLAQDADSAVRDLRLGLSGELLEVYAWVQQRLSVERGQPIEPAYVLLSERQGGYGRIGFFLGDVDKRHAGYVDVHRDWPITGRFGSVDQLFPHELAHVLRRQLIGEILEGNTNQIHALGVRTDRVVAFNEGFAEHLQAAAIDHPQAHPDTAALARDAEAVARVDRYLDRYRRELTARLAIAPPMRVGFVAWYANGEDLLRYSAVKGNDFAREPDIPSRLLRTDPYAAYLLASVLPGAPEGVPKPVGRMVSTEAVVAALYYRWARDPVLRSSYRDEAFYERFGTTAAQVSPLQNVYLKLFDSFLEHRPWDTLAAIESYRRSFPDEADQVDRIVSEVFLGQAPQAPPELWLLNDSFHTGTTLFDQYRGMPRPHTFDLNAASLVDLVAMPGLDHAMAMRIAAAAPFASVEEVGTVEGVDAAIVGTLEEMEAAMARLQASAEDEEELTLSIMGLLMPSIWRAVAALLLSAVLGGLVYATVRRRGGACAVRWLRVAINGIAVGIVACTTAWLAGPAAALGVVGLLLGLPGAALELRSSRQPALAGVVLLAWLASSLVAVVVTTPW